MKRHIDDIQILRAVAAIAVLFFHLEREISGSRPGAFGTTFVDVAWLGQVGVDIFFVISGFIMYFVHYQDFAKLGMSGQFFLRRLIRIVPSYWLLTTITVAGLVFLPELFNSRTPDWAWITASYLFVPWQAPAGDISPPVGPGWTLNYEMYFYVIFALLLLVPRRIALPVMTVFMTASAVLGVILQPQVPMLGLMTSALLIEFLCGIWLAWAFVTGITLRGPVLVLLTLAAVAVFATGPMVYVDGDLATWWRLPFFGLPAATIVATVLLRAGLQDEVRQPGLLRRALMRLGDSSYALYLTHVFTLRICSVVLHRLLPPPPPRRRNDAHFQCRDLRRALVLFAH